MIDSTTTASDSRQKEARSDLVGSTLLWFSPFYNHIPRGTLSGPGSLVLSLSFFLFYFSSSPLLTIGAFVDSTWMTCLHYAQWQYRADGTLRSSIAYCYCCCDSLSLSLSLSLTLSLFACLTAKSQSHIQGLVHHLGRKRVRGENSFNIPNRESAITSRKVQDQGRLQLLFFSSWVLSGNAKGEAIEWLCVPCVCHSVQVVIYTVSK